MDGDNDQLWLSNTNYYFRSTEGDKGSVVLSLIRAAVSQMLHVCNSLVPIQSGATGVTSTGAHPVWCHWGDFNRCPPSLVTLG